MNPVPMLEARKPFPRSERLSRAPLLVASVLLLVGCGGEDDEPASAAPCSVDEDCGADEVCAVEGVREIQLEEGDDARCVARRDSIGARAPSWAFTGPGRPLADRLCLAGGLNRGAGTESDAIRARQRELLGATGARMIRLDFPWKVVEPEKGKLDFSELDPMVEVATSMGVEVIGIVAYGVPWASSLTETDAMFPPDDPADYAGYARALAVHYQGKVRHFELWNEPNGGWRFFRPNLHGDPAKYAAMMVAAAGAIREVCADCTVYSAGLFFHNQVVNGAVEFTSDMLTASPTAFEAVDRYGIHPYTQYPPRAEPESEESPERSLSGMLEDVEAVFAVHHQEMPPLAATELGWPSYAPVSEEDQASFLAREVLLGAALGLDPLCWFNLADGPKHGSFPPEDDFGLYRFPSEDPAQAIDPKPSRDAIAFLAALGKDATPKGTPALHDPADGRFALDFETPSGTWTAIWRRTGSETLHLPGEIRHGVDLTGKPVAQPGNGALDVPVGSSPIFIVP